MHTRKEHEPCHSPASSSSRSRSTASAPAKVRASTHRSATPANGCTNGCSPPGGGTRWSASPAAPAASTTPSCGCTIRGRRRDHGCREVRPARMARGPGVEGLVGSQPAVPHPDLRPHPSPAPVDRDGGRHDVPLHRRLAGRGARDGPRRCGRPGRPHRRRCHHDPRVPCRRARRPHAHRRWSRSCSAEAYASGTDWRASRRTTRSRPPPRPAESRM